MTMEIIAELLKLAGVAGLAIAAILAITIWKKNRTTKITYIRLVIQMVAFAGIFYMFIYPIRPLYILAVILLMPIVIGRFFCGWLCPFGLYMDVITLIRKSLKIRYRNLSDRLNKLLHNFRYILFFVFLLLVVVFIVIDPVSDSSLLMLKMQIFAPPFEHLGILLSPLVPLIVPWEGPLEISGLFFSYPYIQEVIKYSGENFADIMAITFLSLNIVGSFFIRRAWCRFCPTGISIAALNKLRGFKWAPILHLNKDEEKCTKCGICKRVCPVQVTEIYDQKGGKIKTTMCLLCTRCVEMCPYENCLEIKFGNKTVLKSRNWLEPSEID